MNKILYEAPQSLSNTEIQVRYEPEWLISVNIPLLLYKAETQGENNEIEIKETETIGEQTISFNSIMGGDSLGIKRVSKNDK